MKKKFESLIQLILFSDVINFSLLVLILLKLYLSIPTWSFAPENMDAFNYLKMAKDPFIFLDPSIPPHHAQRFFPSWLVYLLHQTGVSIYAGFYILSRILYTIWIIGIYVILRHLTVRPILALCLCALTPFTYWSHRYLLSNLYQLNDLCAFAFPILLLVAFTKKNSIALLILSCIAVMCRQNLLVISVGSMVALSLQEKSWKIFFQAWIPTIIFYGSTKIAGGGAMATLIQVTTFNPMEAYSAFWHSDVLNICAPFLIWSIHPKAYKLLFKYWWITAFALITMLQPMGFYYATGPANFQRIFTQGSWWFVILAGVSLETYLKKTSYHYLVLGGLCLTMILDRSGNLNQLTAFFYLDKILSNNVYFATFSIIVLMSPACLSRIQKIYSKFRKNRLESK